MTFVADYADILEVDIAFLVAMFVLLILSIIVAGNYIYITYNFVCITLNKKQNGKR